MTLDPRRIALQGVGYTALVVALQGFASIDGPDVPPVVVGGGGGWSRPTHQPGPDRRRHRDEELILIMGMAMALLHEENE